MDEQDRIKAERARLRKEFGELFDEASSILFELDPVGINFETNTDEYEPEVGTILPRLRSCFSEVEALRIIHEEFVRWFDEVTAGLESNYEEAAKRLWAAWNRRPAT